MRRSVLIAPCVLLASSAAADPPDETIIVIDKAPDPDAAPAARDRDRALGLERPVGGAHRVQVAALEARHLDVRAAVLGDPGVVHGDKRAVADRGGLARLADHARAELGVGRVALVDDLERDVAAQDPVVRGVHRADAAAAEQRLDDVLAGDHLAEPLLGAGFGPDGVSARVLDVTRNVMRLQTGYLYHYAFAMLIGAAAFITWFMFAVH